MLKSAWVNLVPLKASHGHEFALSSTKNRTSPSILPSPHHLFSALKVKSPLGIQLWDKMKMPFLIFVTQAQNLLVLDTRSFISRMSEANTEPKTIIHDTWYVWRAAPARIPVVRASIARAE